MFESRRTEWTELEHAHRMINIHPQAILVGKPTHRKQATSKPVVQ